MEYKNILLECSDAIARITINRPKQLNALNSVTIAELNTAITTIDPDGATLRK